MGRQGLRRPLLRRRHRPPRWPRRTGRHPRRSRNPRAQANRRPIRWIGVSNYVCCEDAILMLRNHASLALWVSGNEVFTVPFGEPFGPWPDVPTPPGLNGMLQNLVEM